MNKRLYYGILTILTMALGLGVRHLWQYLPDWINIWIGDFIWAIMLFWACRTVFVYSNPRKMTLLLILFCWFIETSQQFHTPWLDAFRATTFGGLLLGHGFLWSDMAAYTAGALFGYATIFIRKWHCFDINFGFYSKK
jgi:Protein of unknown function (DUF2809)